MTTNLQRWGNSHGIRIPKFILDTLQWTGDEELTLSADNGQITIRKAEPRKNIKELFENFDGEYKPSEFDFGGAVGKEVW